MIKRVYRVYIHTSPNKKKYIGISRQKNIKKRWLNGRGYISNNYFTKAIKKYGWDNFKHEIIFCNLTKEEAEMLEVELIKYHKTANSKFGYNISNGGNSSGKLTEESKNKIKNKLAYLSKRVINIDTGKIFNSINEASKFYNVNRNTIVGSCNGQPQRTTKYRWAFLNKDNTFKEPIIRDIKTKSKVINLTTNKIFNSISEASKFYNIRTSGISRVCNGGAEFCGGFKWKYFDKISKNIFIKKSKKIINLDTGEIFKSIAEAGRFYSVQQSSIGLVCKNKRITAGGFRWQYYE